MPGTDSSSHPLLQVGSKGAGVQRWQRFLAQQKLLSASDVDGDFGQRTRQATEKFQSAQGLAADGVVGPNTWRAAEAVMAASGEPPWPPFEALTDELRAQLFGKFDFRRVPTANDPEAIEILGTWQKDNVAIFTVPQVVGIPFSWSTERNSGRVQFHRKAMAQLLSLFAAWQGAGLMDRVVSWGGAYNARLQRGSTTLLSNHSFGTAFDINVKENPLGKPGAAKGTRGSVVELVALANEHGFYWGGHFHSRLDAQHFEIAVLK